MTEEEMLRAGELVTQYIPDKWAKSPAIPDDVIEKACNDFLKSANRWYVRLFRDPQKLDEEKNLVVLFRRYFRTEVLP